MWESPPNLIFMVGRSTRMEVRGGAEGNMLAKVREGVRKGVMEGIMEVAKRGIAEIVKSGVRGRGLT